ncbi:MAG: hypothetical protein ETSY2_30710 [Candidatus Entotheonella gemina]|uniref:Uncharacterized protein n=1 Tax=Candidatus Entotheonella gemina TaxID=1429439 RepID=W4M189_9BACT|nr:MAG: hypothetical protein ETSY2_30710 [Candidatus Entotheonella gemina]
MLSDYPCPILAIAFQMVIRKNRWVAKIIMAFAAQGGKGGV